MDLKQLQCQWDEAGKIDPFWAILSRYDKKNGGWELHEFFETGQHEIERVLEYVTSLGRTIRTNRALDFGCGVGRLTQALAAHFEETVGVDIAPSMIELAKTFNRHGKKCKYYVNETNDLNVFPDNSFDFIYSSLTLQHMEPRYSLNYLREFLRVLVPGGHLIFQLPSDASIQCASIVEGEA